MGEWYYIQNTLNPGGDCCLWWKINGHGYTCNLDLAWKLPRVEIERMRSRLRPEQDIPRLVSEVDALAVRHVPK